LRKKIVIGSLPIMLMAQAPRVHVRCDRRARHRHRNRSAIARLDAGLPSPPDKIITFQNGSFRNFPELR
jgi:hypothetical protein